MLNKPPRDDAPTEGRILDYSIRVSSREAYVSPTRGAQGNALKTILANHPKITHTTSPSDIKVGTQITVARALQQRGPAQDLAGVRSSCRPGDWQEFYGRGEYADIDLEGRPVDLGPIQWTASPPKFFCAPRESFAPIPGQTIPELGHAWYTGFVGDGGFPEELLEDAVPHLPGVRREATEAEATTLRAKRLRGNPRAFRAINNLLGHKLAADAFGRRIDHDKIDQQLKQQVEASEEDASEKGK